MLLRIKSFSSVVTPSSTFKHELLKFSKRKEKKNQLNPHCRTLDWCEFFFLPFFDSFLFIIYHEKICDRKNRFFIRWICHWVHDFGFWPKSKDPVRLHIWLYIFIEVKRHFVLFVEDTTQMCPNRRLFRTKTNFKCASVRVCLDAWIGGTLRQGNWNLATFVLKLYHHLNGENCKTNSRSQSTWAYFW